MENNTNPRRKFLKTAAWTAGISTLGPVAAAAPEKSKPGKLLREVWVACISQEGLQAATAESMVDQLFLFMNKTLLYRPDVICLPEVFPTSNVSQAYTVSEKVEISQKTLKQLSDFARQHQCYVIAPVYTHEHGNTYNAAVVMDRAGNDIGEYRKIHLTENEIESGLAPGPLDPPVFDTDFGKVGVQICFDIMWDDAWSRLKEKGVEMVFWPSAYGGGQTINAKAGLHRYVLASSTRKGASKLCDITGLEISKTGSWDKNYFCAPVNLEKAFLHTWPYVQQFDKIREKYGRKVLITNFHEEEWSVIESLSPEVRIASIMQEFNLKTYDQHKFDSEKAQIEARKNLNRL